MTFAKSKPVMNPVTETTTPDRTNLKGQEAAQGVMGRSVLDGGGRFMTVEGVGPRDRLWIGRRESGQIEVYLNGRYVNGVHESVLENILIRQASKKSSTEITADVSARVAVEEGTESRVIHKGRGEIRGGVGNPSMVRQAHHGARLVIGGAENPLAPRKPKALPSNFGTKKGESLDAEFRKFEEQIKKMSGEAQKGLTQTRDMKQQKFYSDLINALNGDLAYFKKIGSNGSRKERINELNRMNRELYLEATYNVNLTGKGVSWSQKDLDDFEWVMKRIGSPKLTTNSEAFSTIRLEKLAEGVGGSNHGNGLITIKPGGVKDHLIHEIGHNFEDENPKWKEFKNLSGWKNVTDQFKAASGDYSSDGAYQPYNGQATLKRDGKVYKDGESVDVDGDGKTDGIVQVQYGKVFIHGKGSPFISGYAHVGPKEDFAETFEEFFEHPALLKKWCPEKFLFMVDFVGKDPTAVKGRPIIKV